MYACDSATSARIAVINERGVWADADWKLEPLKLAPVDSRIPGGSPESDVGRTGADGGGGDDGGVALGLQAFHEAASARTAWAAKKAASTVVRTVTALRDNPT
jgi:hypothetical protein